MVPVLFSPAYIFRSSKIGPIGGVRYVRKYVIKSVVPFFLG